MPLEEKSDAPSVPPSKAGQSDAISTAVPTPGQDDSAQRGGEAPSPVQHAESPVATDAKKKRKTKRARGLLAFLFGRDA